MFIIIVFRLGLFRPLDFFFLRAHFTSILAPFSELFFVFFHSCCSHAREFGKTLHEFISYSHTEWDIHFSASAITRAQKRTLCEMAILSQALVTLYKQNYCAGADVGIIIYSLLYGVIAIRIRLSCDVTDVNTTE